MGGGIATTSVYGDHACLEQMTFEADTIVEIYAQEHPRALRPPHGQGQQVVDQVDRDRAGYDPEHQVERDQHPDGGQRREVHGRHRLAGAASRQ